MTVSNQKPAILSPVYTSAITGNFDPRAYLKKTLAQPLFTPLIPQQKVSIKSNGADLTEDIIAQKIIDCCGDTVNMAAELSVKEIFNSTLVNFDKNTNLPVQELFPIQSAVTEKMPFPNASCVYTPATDVIPTMRQFLGGSASYDKMFASLAFYARPEVLGFYFANEISFNDFKQWFQTQWSTLASVLPSDVNQLCTQFLNLKLDGLTESLKLRKTDTDGNDPNSFPRLLIALLMNYTTQISNAEYGVLPFHLGELFCPRNIVFINLERHAHATAKEIANEWNIIKQASKLPINMVSNNKLTKLTATVRNLQKIKGAAAAATKLASPDPCRSANIQFKKSAPTIIDIAHLIKRVLNNMQNVAKSENTYKQTKLTFAKPNRRDPDDFNKMGKSVSTKYKPDIHIYLDTSGSISERNYQDAVKACIRMAKKLNVNLYFNSFSHIMSQTTHLRTKDKPLSQVYAAFQKVPKVTGGTNFAQIWEFINANPKRKRELSLMITDFEYTIPTQIIEHPKNLYYMPCSHMNWDDMVHYADRFCTQMLRNDPEIRKHILF